jgi:M-phase inducer tyrosine phosphatase
MGEIRRSASTVVTAMPLPNFDDYFDGPSRSYAEYRDNNCRDQKDFLPTVPKPGSVPRITGRVLCEILDGQYDDHFDELFIIDGRYGYEHRGGCIRGAQNINSPDLLIDAFFKEPIPNAVIIFHCEFSHNRGPQLAAIFRKIDRNMNKFSYPNLLYPHVYILDGGYRDFFVAFPQLCDGGYTPMLDEFHRSNGDLTKETTKFQKKIDDLKFFSTQEKGLTKNHIQCPITLRALNFSISSLQSRE